MRAVIADDDRVTTTVLARALQQQGLDVEIANDGASAWQLLNSGRPTSLAIMDWEMPGLDGIELCRRIRNEPSLVDTYLILLTGRGSRLDLVTGLEAGADDYMVKPIHHDELRARVKTGVRIAKLQADRAERIRELQAARDELNQLVSTDALTRLHSRREWFRLANIEFSRSRRYERTLSAIFLDLDFFKQINDTYGHESGDQVLQRFADMLRFVCRECDIIGRLGGEEFAILVPETSLTAAEVLAGRIAESCRNLSVPTPNGTVTCRCSIGISEAMREDGDIETVLRRADVALYDAKRNGRDGWKCYNPVDLRHDESQMSFHLV